MASGFIRNRTILAIAALTVVLSSISGLQAGDRFITIASTTSTRNSGLYDHILPLFTNETGIKVRVVAVGTGQAIKIAQNGDADALFVHHKPSEDKFVTAGYGLNRLDVMYNDFLLVGPRFDPAKVAGSTDIIAALTKIAKIGHPFASRGDDSGTHKMELGLWKASKNDPRKKSRSWYRETGSGMGATLNTASAMNAYTLTDRGTWLKFSNKRELKALVEGDNQLFNPYGIIVVNPAQHPHIKRADAEAFANWLVSKAGQKAIAAYKIKGQQAFFPNAQGFKK